MTTNTAIESIHYTNDVDALGGIDAGEYESRLERELAEHYPDAEVTITRGQTIGSASRVTLVDGSDPQNYETEVNEFAASVWDAMCRGDVPPTAAEPNVMASNGETATYSEARIMWENGEFSDWVERHGGWPIEVAGEETTANGCENALSDDQWDTTESTQE